MIIFDTETTGLIQNVAKPLAQQPQIIEFYAMKLDDETLEEQGRFHSLFFAKEVPQEVTSITGITTEQLKSEPRFSQKFDELCEFFLGERILAGHNLSFDRDMLMFELRRLNMVTNFPWPKRHICTVESTEAMDGFRLSLMALHEKLFGHKFDSAHRAQADVEATAACLRELVNRGIIEI